VHHAEQRVTDRSKFGTGCRYVTPVTQNKDRTPAQRRKVITDDAAVVLLLCQSGQLVLRAGPGRGRRIWA
jgi:hypothetical protein